MASGRIQQLQKLQKSLPMSNQQVQQGTDAANQMRLQDMVKQAPAGTASVTPIAQQLGGAQASAAGQANLQTQQQNIQQGAQVGALQLQQKGTEQQAELGQKQRAVSQYNRKQQNMLAKLSQEKKNELLDQQLEFNKDQRGQTQFNERQLADWAATNARSQEEFNNYSQIIQQAANRKLQYLQVQNSKVSQVLQSGYLNEKQRLDNETRKQLLVVKKELEQKMADDKAKRNNRRAIFQGVGTIVGTVAGAYFTAGNPAGAAAGGAVGSAAGSGLASATE